MQHRHSEQEWSPRIADVLRETWGFDALRPLQEEAIQANLSARDSLLVMPTGGGKSLTYQLPSLLVDGLTVVACPLISLMKDQVDGLLINGVKAVSLHSGQDEKTRHQNRQQIQTGESKLLYVSPEMLVGGSLNGLLRTVGVRAFAIDEAHCISHWGHDFRPEYRRLADLRDVFPQASFHACTATATPQVRQDILEALRLSDPAVLVGDFDRPNLTLRIRRREGGRDQLVEEVRRHDGEGVIVYALSRKDTEQIASRLCKEGLKAEHYHAGLSPRQRERVQTRFAREEVNIVVATVAFGMGIDRSNIRAVIHASMPRSIEHYQQETGRAGRDGEPADCVMFHSYADVDRWRRLATRSFEEAVAEGGEVDSLREDYLAKDELLEDMNRMASGMRCRHQSIVTYFGGQWDRGSCKACDVCLDEIEMLPDGQDVARMILSCVARVDQNFGVGHLSEVLCGSEAQSVLRWRHHELSTWGLLKRFHKKEVVHLIHQMIDHGYLHRTRDDRPVVVFSEQSSAVMRGELEIQLMRPPKPRRAGRSVTQAELDEGVDADLLEKLKLKRKAVAIEQEVPAYVVFSDRTLKAMAKHRPSALRTMRMLHGIGDAKLQSYAPVFLEVIDSHCGDDDRDLDLD